MRPAPTPPPHELDQNRARAGSAPISPAQTLQTRDKSSQFPASRYSSSTTNLTRARARADFFILFFFQLTKNVKHAKSSLFDLRREAGGGIIASDLLSFRTRSIREGPKFLLENFRYPRRKHRSHSIPFYSFARDRTAEPKGKRPSCQAAAIMPLCNIPRNRNRSITCFCPTAVRAGSRRAVLSIAKLASKLSTL